jgi:poly(hydroxyalkanoate) depolymerase family esterase
VEKKRDPVIDIPKRLSSFLSQRKKWENVMRATARMRAADLDSDSQSSHLRETLNFGSNPGALRMFTYVPDEIPAECGLVVVLHGCTQSAAGYDLGAGWSTLAKRFGFALLLPQQKRSNNPNGCFNWFQKGDIERGHGEALSIRQMVEKMISDHRLDRTRVFVTGLSAGGAMTSVMLATYPDVFAGGAIIAGLPYGAANNVQQAFENMFQCPPRPARAWGDLVRGASQYAGPWPRVSVWHGEADVTVIPSNASEIVKQWTDVHSLPLRPSTQEMVDGYPRQVWVNAAGDELIESYTIPRMAHGTPLATGEADDKCGAAGPFLLEVGISSSYHIARFFRLTNTSLQSVASAESGIVKVAPEKGYVSEPAAARDSLPVLEGEVLDPEDAMQEHTKIPPSPPIDIAAVITRALQGAGLIKGR